MFCPWEESVLLLPQIYMKCAQKNCIIVRRGWVHTRVESSRQVRFPEIAHQKIDITYYNYNIVSALGGLRNNKDSKILFPIVQHPENTQLHLLDKHLPLTCPVWQRDHCHLLSPCRGSNILLMFIKKGEYFILFKYNTFTVDSLLQYLL